MSNISDPQTGNNVNDGDQDRNQNADEFVMGPLDSASSWVIVVVATSIILFFLCLVICLIRDDWKIMNRKKNGGKYVSPRKKSPIKINKGKKYEQCDESNISGDSMSDFDADYYDEHSSVSDEAPGGHGRESESRDSEYVPGYWRHRTSNTLRMLKLI